jgi:S-DNA-T family DNA segregation ATPase FtsK/SpoIIIE
MEVNITGASTVLEANIPTEEESPAVDDPEQLWQKTLQQFGKFDPTLELGSYQSPAPDLLENHANRLPVSREELMAELEANKDRIVETLGHYNISIEKIKATVGPTVTLFEIVPKAGIRISRIKSLEDDIALSLSALGIRIIAPIPGKGTIGIEVPNQRREIVSIKSILTSERFLQCQYELPIGLGKTIANEVFVADLTRMPHLLIAGATGQGKSVGLNAILLSLLYKKHPAEVKFVMVDPKKVELTLYKRIERHFLATLPGEEEPIITETRKVVNTLNSLCIEMDKRYDLLKDAQVRNIREYNDRFVQRRLNPNDGHSYLPYIVLVIDEFADLIMMAGKEIETPIARIAQLARAVGIHLIIATQRPSVNIITGTIKANFPARMAFRVTSRIDSRTILDSGGAEQLIGSGDMLLATGGDLIRLQCAYVDTSEVDRVTEFIGSQRGYPHAFLLPEYSGENEETGLQSLENDERDPLFEEAARIIVQYQQGSASLLQRKLKLGYNRAGRIIDQLEAAGIIGPFEGSKAREVKIKDLMTLEQQLNALHSSNR